MQMSRSAKTFIFALLATIATSCSPKAANDSDSFAFKFHEDGTFKILQVTDVHVDWDMMPEYGTSYNQLCDMLESGKPDLAILTGDIVTESAGGEAPWEKYLEPFDKYGVPFIVEYGNHDRENVLMDTRMAEIIKSHPFCANRLVDGYVDDNAVEVLSADGSKVAAVLYAMDSGDYSMIPTVGEYGWFAPSQLTWYNETSRAYRMANAGVPVPSYMFMHIPFTEFYQAYTEGCEEGERNERECPGYLNSGMFAQVCANADVHGVFVGHDHSNDYIADAGHVALVYGRFSGGDYARNGGKNGMRFIELKEGDYGFRTWIRTLDGEIIMDHTYDPGIDYSLHKAVKAEGKENGALFAWYDGAGSLEAMASMTPAQETVPIPRHECYHSQEPHGFGYECYIYIPETGLWRFRTGERKNGRIMLDDIELSTVYNRNVTEINLEKGFHKLDAKAWVKGGRSDFKLTWMAPSSDRLRDVPAECFFVK